MGTTTDHISAFWDVMPTIAEITNAELPENLDGISFLPTLLSHPEQQEIHDALYWEYHAFGGMQAVRMGKWKAVRLEIRRQDDAPIQLFDLEQDISESNDLADQYPEVVDSARSVMESRTVSSIDRWNFIREK